MTVLYPNACSSTIHVHLAPGAIGNNVVVRGSNNLTEAAMALGVGGDIDSLGRFWVWQQRLFSGVMALMINFPEVVPPQEAPLTTTDTTTPVTTITTTSTASGAGGFNGPEEGASVVTGAHLDSFNSHLVSDSTQTSTDISSDHHEPFRSAPLNRKKIYSVYWHFHTGSPCNVCAHSRKKGHKAPDSFVDPVSGKTAKN
ncbi:hypothetical protein LZ31DRAFT_591338 [Colletotrichum somersetense]|nr:hypothetical protein LZ31DRAFT_591338 [Colletotrichum somersetense]